MDTIRRFLCRYLNIHDWRYASRYTKPGYESRARCQWCEIRKWDRLTPEPTPKED